MTMQRILLGAMLLAGLAAAPADALAPRARAASGFQHAYIHRDCAPWDGSAWRLVIQHDPVAPIQGQASPRGALPAPAYPHYTVALWMGDPPRGRWIAIPGEAEHKMGTGHIGYVTAGPKHERRQGRIRIDARTATSFTGELRVLLPDGSGRELVLPFRARIVPYQALCG